MGKRLDPEEDLGRLLFPDIRGPALRSEADVLEQTEPSLS
jgi:hypothetical protein